MPTTYERNIERKSIYKYFSIFLLCLTIITALLIRTGALALKNSEESIFQDDSSPQLINPDGYFYLSIAKELIDGTYSTIDTNRIHPEGISRPSYPPLLPSLIAGLSKTTTISIDTIGVFFPVFTSLLLAIPLFLFGKKLAGPVFASFGVFLGLTAPIYASRTSLGLLDTDCLNLFFPLMIAYSFYAFATGDKKSRFLWLLIGLGHFFLFFWWWDMAPAVVIAFTLVPLLLAFIAVYRAANRNVRIFLLLTGGGLLSILLISQPSYIFGLTKGLFGKISYITQNSSQQSIFPLTSLTNSEQQSIPILTLAGAVCKPYLLFVAGATGLLWMLFRRSAIFLYLLPLIIVGGLSIYASRFIIFLVPTITLGIVFLLAELQKLTKHKTLFISSCCLLLIFSGWENLKKPPIHKPVFSNRVIAGMKQIKNLTPENSVIYSWWDDGHLLIHYGERPTIADGAYHSGSRISYLAIPFATENFQFAANFIRFYSTYGLPGINRFFRESQLKREQALLLLENIYSLSTTQKNNLILEELVNKPGNAMPADEWISFLFPEDGPEVYLFLENRYFKPNLQRTLHWYGTWDTEKKSGTTTLPTIILTDISIGKDGNVNTPDLNVNYTDGSLHFPQVFNSDIPLAAITLVSGVMPIKKYNFRTTKDERIINPNFTSSYSVGRLPHLNTNIGRYSLQVLPTQNEIFLQDQKIANMLCQQLFFHTNDSPNSPYFSLIAEDPYHFQLWKVR